MDVINKQCLSKLINVHIPVYSSSITMHKIRYQTEMQPSTMQLPSTYITQLS